MPFAFTEQGVAMLASVLRSETAIRVSLQIMNAFVAMRHFLMQNGGFVNRLSNVEAKIIDQDERILLPLLAFDILLHLLSLLFANLP